MKTELKPLSAVRKELHIEVPASEVEAEERSVLQAIGKQIKLPGFRPGKVPINIVRQRFRKEIEAELMERMLPRVTSKALEQHGLKPLAPPAYKDVVFEPEAPLKFVAHFEVPPAIDADGYRDVPLEAEPVELTDKDVERELEHMRELGAMFETVEPRPLEAGDFALVDISSEVEGQREEREKVIMAVVTDPREGPVGSRLVGMRPGESREVVLEDEGGQPEGASVRRVYQVACHEVKRKQLPELDDEFARDQGKFAGLAELREHVRKELVARKERERRRQLERQLQEVLAARLDFEAPSTLVEAELDSVLSDEFRAMEARGIDPREANVDWQATRDRLREDAARHVRWTLFLDAVADKEGIQAESADVEARLAELALQSGRSVDFLRSKIAQGDQKHALEASVRRGKVVDFLIQGAKISGRSS